MDKFEDTMSHLHRDMTHHLSQLHLLHHKQQIVNIELLIQQAYQRVEGSCNLHDGQLSDLLGVIETNLEKDQVFSIINAFSEFLSAFEGDDCGLDQLNVQLNSYLGLVQSETGGVHRDVQFLDLSSIDAEQAYNRILDPLSNQKRLDIMLAISHYKKRFKDLEHDLDLQAGHLIYHLNPLKERGYVDQDSKKNYRLTEKGIAVLEAIKHIYDTYLD